MDIYDIIRELSPESAEDIINRIEAQPAEDRPVLKDKLRQSLAREVRQESRFAFGSQESIDGLLGREDDDPGAFVGMVHRATAEANDATPREYTGKPGGFIDDDAPFPGPRFAPLSELSQRHPSEDGKPPIHLQNEYRKDGTRINKPSASDFELR